MSLTVTLNSHALNSHSMDSHKSSSNETIADSSSDAHSHEHKFVMRDGIEYIGNYEVICGLEIHAQVNSNTKLFSRAPNNFGDNPNSNVDFLDMSFPGILPLLNEKCVHQAVKTGLALNCDVNKLSFFERKHYFYPDLPSGYQISQLKSPICTDGYVEIDDGDEKITKVRINRIQLEQDAGKSTHDTSDKYSFIDLNRAGIPLMEIVSEPDIRSVFSAVEYVKKIRSILQYLETSSAKMEAGEFRVDANISLRIPGENLGNRVEIKNVNSLKFLEDALRYECRRQVKVLQNGEIVNQETRLFDPKKGITVSMRKKEDALDYRYFRDPDLFPVVISQDYISKIKSEIPELPEEKCSRFMKEFDLSSYQANILVNEKSMAAFFEKTIDEWKNIKQENSDMNSSMNSSLIEFSKSCCNWLTGDIFALINAEKNESAIEMKNDSENEMEYELGYKMGHEVEVENDAPATRKTNKKNESKIPFSEKHFAILVQMVLSDELSTTSAKKVINHMWKKDENPEKIVKELGLSQINDKDEIIKIITEVLNENPSELQAYLNGKDKLFGFFIGKVMKKSGGNLNPPLLNELMKGELENRK